MSNQQHQSGAETVGPHKTPLNTTATPGPRDVAAPRIDGTELAPTFEVRLEPARELVRVRLIGELDLATGPELREQITELLAVGFEHLIIDLRDLSFLDATGLTLLLALADRARDEGWRLSLIHAHGQVRRICELTNTLSRLPLHPTHDSMMLDSEHDRRADQRRQMKTPGQDRRAAPGAVDDLDTILMRAQQAGIDRWRVMIALGITPQRASRVLRGSAPADLNGESITLDGTARTAGHPLR